MRQLQVIRSGRPRSLPLINFPNARAQQDAKERCFPGQAATLGGGVFLGTLERDKRRSSSRLSWSGFAWQHGIFAVCRLPRTRPCQRSNDAVDFLGRAEGASNLALSLGPPAEHTRNDQRGIIGLAVVGPNHFRGLPRRQHGLDHGAWQNKGMVKTNWFPPEESSGCQTSHLSLTHKQRCRRHQREVLEPPLCWLCPSQSAVSVISFLARRQVQPV